MSLSYNTSIDHSENFVRDILDLRKTDLVFFDRYVLCMDSELTSGYSRFFGVTCRGPFGSGTASGTTPFRT